MPFHSFLKALQTLAGSEGVRGTLALLSSEISEPLRRGRLALLGWYPLAWYKALHEAAQRSTGSTSSLARAIGHETMRSDLSGIFRVFLLVLSPQALIAKAPRLYAQYFDTGSVVVQRCEAQSAHLSFRGCSGFDDNMWEDVLGSVEESVAMAGGKQVRVEMLARETGPAARAEMAIVWA